jgi:hypothetical protein
MQKAELPTLLSAVSVVLLKRYDPENRVEVAIMRLRLATSLLLAVAVTIFFSARSFAAPELPTAPILPSEGGTVFVGTLTATGYVTVNGNEARTGATILNNSRVATGPDGDAMIDLGPLGRIQLRPDTEIKLILSPNNCQVEILRCGSLTQTVPPGVTAQAKKMEPGLMEVAVLPGEAQVNSINEEEEGTIIRTGENRVFHHFESVTAKGDSIFTLNCCDCDLVPGGFIFPPIIGWWGFIVAVAGTGVGVTIGVDTGDEDPSPTQP